MPPAKDRTATRPGAGRTVPATDWWADTYRPRVAHGDLPAVLGALGFNVNRDGYLDPNPLRGERTPSAHVYDDHVTDYGDDPNKPYDPVAFLMAARGLDKRDAADLYADAAGIPRMDGERGKRANLRPVRPTKAKAPKVPRKLDTSWLTPLTEAAAAALEAAESPEAKRAHELLTAWGITPEVRRYLRLGVIDATVRDPQRPHATTGRERRMWWAYLEGDRTIYGNARAMYGEEPKTLVHAASIVGSRPAPYNVAAFDHAPTAGYLLMLEGEKDTAAALVALGVDAPALGLMGGTMPAEGAWCERVAQLGVPAVVCFDRDEAGEGKAAKLTAALRAAGCTDVRLVSIPSPHKDAADVLAAEGADVLRDVLQTWRRAPSVEADDLPERPPGDPGPTDADAPPDAAIIAQTDESPPERKRPKLHAAPSHARPVAPLMTAAELVGLELPPVRPVVADLIVPGLNVFAGPYKLGKSWLVLQMAHQVAVGGRFFNRPTEQGRAIYYALEDGPRRLQSRVERQGIDAGKLDALMFGTELPRIDAGGIDHLARTLDRYTDTRLVVIDTFTRFRPAKTSGNGNAYDTDSQLGDTLQRLALERDVALVLVTHVRKMPADDVFDTITGSVGVPGTADAVIVLKRKRGESDGVLSVTSRDFGEREDALRFDTDTGTWHLLGSAAEYALTKQRRQVYEAVRELGVASPSAVADFLAGAMEPNLVRVTMQRMEKAGELTLIDRGKYTIPRPLGA